MKKYIVYMHVNKSNNKKYIGITCMKPNKRWQKGKGYKANNYFMSAINKYGWDNFEHNIIYSDLCESEAKKKEIELIRILNTTNPKAGYNISKGGDGCSGIKKSKESIEKTVKGIKEYYKTHRGSMYGKHHSNEVKMKLSKSCTGWHHNELTKGKISKARLGIEVSDATKEKLRKINIGKIESEETRKKISKSLKGKYTGSKSSMFGRTGSKHHNSRPVEQINIKTNEVTREFECIADVERILGISHQSISRCCSGQRKTCHGYKWRYKDD